ncbi:MAG: site-2 protease family protein [Clostridia bacterium]|nr:site-2 protease family protein [Clostridia bacterium]
MNLIAQYLITVPAVLLAIILHELAHGYMADRLGDPTPRSMGRLTLNPLKHLDPIGTLCMIFFHFGWARPVPINSRFFKNKKRDIALTALAGPVTNLLLSLLSVPAYLFLERSYVSAVIAGEKEAFFTGVLLSLFYFFYYFHLVNLGLCLFNLIPIPPLDGSRILFAFLPPKYYFSLMRYERYFPLALMLVLLSNAKLGFLSFFSSALSGAMESLWMLLPIFH